MKALQKNLRELLRYPSAIFGLSIVTILILVAVYALISIPYDEAVRLWRGGEDVWYQNPKNVPPEWTNFFRARKLPGSFTLNSTDGTAEKVVEEGSSQTQITLTYTFDYEYDSFPQEMIFYFKSTHVEKQPYVSISWFTPDGREIRVADYAISNSDTFRFSQNEKLKRRLGGEFPQIGLFLDPNADPEDPVALR